MLVEVKESNKKYLTAEDRSEYVKSITWVEDKDIRAIAESIIQPPSKNAGSSYRIIEYYDKSKEDTVYKHVTYENYLEIVSLMTHLSDNYNTRLYDESGYKVVEHDYDSYALVRQWDFNIPNSIEPKPSEVPEDVDNSKILQAFDNDYDDAAYDVVIRAKLESTNESTILRLNYSDIFCVYKEIHEKGYGMNKWYLVLNSTENQKLPLYLINADDYDLVVLHDVKCFSNIVR